ncbi:hypothetical protein ADU90_09280 [Clostridium botulinum]|nr:hypothetical protein ADU89_11765 [Clostridium botulinum]KOC55938.1 hypothetical protein ADU90_09280 [Clostridium botulinum]
MGENMNKVVVRKEDWPFLKGEKVKLKWIGEPFKKDNKWMFYAYFKGNKNTKKILLDWASIHFLSVGKYYTNGNLNGGEALEDKDIMDINLNGVKAEHKERNWEVWGTGFKDKTKSKTFNFSKGGVLYTIPIIEIIRAVLAPDKFMLNRILEMDTLENYFTYEIKESKLDIYFTSEYEKKLLNGSEKTNHLAWLLTNSSILKMFNTVGKNMWELGELEFDFLFERFSIKARVKKKESYIRVLEIVSLTKKRINVDEINIYHPGFQQTHTTNDVKKRIYVSKNSSSDRKLDSSSDGATKDSEQIDTFLIAHEYEKMTKINRVKSGRAVRRNKEDESTKKYAFEDKGLRTTADAGGQEMIKGLEFTNIESVEEKGELEEFVQVLKLLKKRRNIKSVEIIIGELQEGRTGKRFSRLNDGVTKRKYAIGKIVMIDGRECSLIEIEREDKALSMLMLKANSSVKWNWIYSRLLLGLVDESGKWSNEVIKKAEEQGILFYRSKHIKKGIYERAEHIYKISIV